MSRSRKGSKAPGYDFWSRRPNSSNGYGKQVKKITHRIERRISDREIDELELEVDEQELDRQIADGTIKPAEIKRSPDVNN